MVDLLEAATGETGLVLDQVLQIRLGGDRIVAQHGLVPGPVRARPHRMHAGEAAAIAGHDAAGGEQEARQRHDGPEPGLVGIGRIGPQRVVVADAVGVVTDGVARRLVVPRLERIGDRNADALAQIVQPLFGDLGEAVARRELLSSVRMRLLLEISVADRGQRLRDRAAALRLTFPAGVLGSSLTNAM